MIEQRVAPICRNHAQAHANKKADKQRQAHAKHRPRQALRNDAGHRDTIGAIRLAQIAAQQVAEIRHILHGNRLIQRQVEQLRRTLLRLFLRLALQN